MVILEILDAANNLAQRYLFLYEATKDERYLIALATLEGNMQMGQRRNRSAV